MAEDAEAQLAPQSPVYDSPAWETPRKRASVLDWLRTNPAATPAVAAPAKEPTIHESTPEASIDLGTTTPAAASPKTSRLDKWFPPNRTYIGLQRNTFLFLLLLALTIILIILPVALGVGISRANSSRNLPLPGKGGGPWEGDLTYYDPGLGACGWDSRGEEMVAAVSREVWDAEQVGGNPNTNPLCGRKIRVGREFVEEGKGRREVVVTVVDRCVGCRPEDLDVSPTVFRKLARVEDGRVLAEWSWMD